MEEIEFDESQAIRFILDFIPEEDRKGLTEDSVQWVLDAIYDYYNDKGLIDDDTATEASIDEEEMLNYILQAAKEDAVALTSEQLQLIVEGEYEYGVSIGIYEEEE